MKNRIPAPEYGIKILTTPSGWCLIYILVMFQLHGDVCSLIKTLHLTTASHINSNVLGLSISDTDAKQKARCLQCLFFDSLCQFRPDLHMRSVSVCNVTSLRIDARAVAIIKTCV